MDAVVYYRVSNPTMVSSTSIMNFSININLFLKEKSFLYFRLQTILRTIPTQQDFWQPQHSEMFWEQGTLPIHPLILQVLERNLAEILSERESISRVMQDSLDEATDPWGVKAERVEM